MLESSPLEPLSKEGYGSSPSLSTELDELLEQASRRDKLWNRVAIAGAVVFLAFVFVIVPSCLALDEEWTFSAAFFFSIQAAVGIGFNEAVLNIEKAGQRELVMIELIMGSLFVVGVVAYVLSSYVEDVAEAERDDSLMGGRSPLSRDVTSFIRRHQGIIITFVLLLLALTAGVIYGVYQEGWSFINALYFSMSMMQTSGLLSPHVTKHDGWWPSMFLSGLALIGVPLYAYTIAKSASLIARSMRTRQRLMTVLEREKSVEAALMRRVAAKEAANAQKTGAGGGGIPVLSAVASVGQTIVGQRRPSLVRETASPGTLAVDRAGFLELWLLRNQLVSEATLASVDAEFDAIQKGGEATLEDVSTRLKFLQLVALKQIEPERWEEARAAP